MGFIRLSPAAIGTVTSNFMTNIAGGTSFLSPPLNTLNRGFLIRHAGSMSEIGARLAIMKGTVPTDFSTLTSYSARSADALVVFDASPGTSSTGTAEFSPSQATTNPIIISTVYVNAIQSGIATWFWWFTTPLSAPNTFNNATAPLNQIVGTVGISGSGADLTLPSVSISVGNPYRIFNYRLQIPTDWTF